MINWNSRRARLNHDRLKNQFLQSLARLIRVAEGRVVGDDLLHECGDDLAAARAALMEEGGNLLKTAQTQTGPVTWFDRGPLINLDREDREWMLALLLEDWNKFSDFQACLKASKELLRQLDCLTRELLSAIQRTLPSDQLTSNCRLKQDIRAQADELYGISLQLTTILSRLDHGDALQTFARMDEQSPLT